MKKINLNSLVKVVVLGVAIVFVSNKIALLNSTTSDVYGQSQGVSKTYTSYDKEISGKFEDGVQVIEFDLQNNSLPTLNLKAGVPVKLIINADENSLNSCNYIIKSNDFQIQKQLNVGKNEIEFTPNEVGEFTYLCWMGMIGSNINVYDDVQPSAIYGTNIVKSNCCGNRY